MLSSEGSVVQVKIQKSNYTVFLNVIKNYYLKKKQIFWKILKQNNLFWIEFIEPGFQI